MRPPASSSQRICSPHSAHCGRAAITFVLAIAFLTGSVWTQASESHAVAIEVSAQHEPESEAVVISLANVGLPAGGAEATPAPNHASGRSGEAETCENIDMAALSRLPPRAVDTSFLLASISVPTGQSILRRMKNAHAHFGAGDDGVDLIAYSRKPLPRFAPMYRSVRKLAAVMELPRIQGDASQMHATILGTVSTYNPYRDGIEEGGIQTASGELYDPDGWTAAIQIDLRDRFGGVRYGRLYQPAYALVESGEKQVIVKINDVGRLRPGRVLDLNERSMRFFDPFLTRGLIDGKITFLPGEDWTPGPVGGTHLISFASIQ